MTIRVVSDGKQAGQKLRVRVKEYSERHILAVQSTARITAAKIEKEGRLQMRNAGDFGSPRWQEGFRAIVSFVGRANLRIRVTHAVKYWRIFQFGGVIHGRPLLWIPLPFARDAKGIRARDYPGRLFRVDRKGKAPLLLAKGGVPKYFGKRSVRMPKKFRLIEIAARNSRRMGQIFKQEMRRGRR